MSSAQTTQAIASGDLLDLVSSSATTTIYPTDDTILSVLHARFRSDLPYTRIGSTHLVVVNPYKSLVSSGDAAAKEYEERLYRDTSRADGADANVPRPLQPHVYETAAKMYLLMRRKKEAQAVVARGITGSGKSNSMRLLTNQLLLLSAHSKKELAVAQQIKSFLTILDAFGNAKTLMNANASRHGRFLELHFTPEKGRIASAKVLTYNLDKSRLTRLTNEERTFHIFYQFLNGSTPMERDAFNLEDPSDYALLASSGCYRLPAGPFSDDAIAMGETRAALASLGFKPKHLQSIFTILTAILLMSNLQFDFAPESAHVQDTQAYVTNPAVLEQVARLLSVKEEDLLGVLVNRTRYVKKEMFTVILDKEQSEAQRDRCMRDLYAILFAYIVESCNHRLAGGGGRDLGGSVENVGATIPIFLLDQPGFQTRGPSGTTSISLSGAMPLVSAYGSNSFEEFTINFADELLHSFVNKHIFEDDVGFNSLLAQDGVPSISTLPSEDNSMCVEMLRGPEDVLQIPQPVSGSAKKTGGIVGVLARACYNFKSGKGVMAQDGRARDEELVRELTSRFAEQYKGFFTSERNSVIGIPPSTSTGSGATSASAHARRQSLLSGMPPTTMFAVTHYASQVSYDASEFVERDADLLDAAWLSVLRGSEDGFVGRLMGGPSLSAERHAKDESIVVVGQVSSRPLRGASVVVPAAVYAAGGVGRILGIAPRNSSEGQQQEQEQGEDDFMRRKMKEDARREVEERLARVPRLDMGKTYPVVVQLNQTLGEIFCALGDVAVPPRLPALEALIESTNASASGVSPFDPPGTVPSSSAANAAIQSPGTRIFVITHVRPNDSGSPNSFDKRRVKHQLRALGVADVVKRGYSGKGDNGRGEKGEWVVGVERGAFCERYVGRMRGTEAERVRQCERSEGWRVGVDVWWRDEEEGGYVWLTYDAWKGVEDRVRAAEKDAAKGVGVDDGDDANTEYTHGGDGQMLTIPSYSYGGLGGESNDNLLLQRTGADGTRYTDANGMAPPYSPGTPGYVETKEGMGGDAPDQNGGIITKEVGEANAVEQIPSSGQRRWWLRLVWLTTWWMPSLLLKAIGRMKRPDVRLAWREKVTIVWLIFILNGIVIFTIVIFGRLLCPEYDKAWTLGEVRQHQGRDDFYVGIQGRVYDISNFWKGPHSTNGVPNNSPDVPELMGGQDLTQYFPPPLNVACPILVTEPLMELTIKNDTVGNRRAVHKSGALNAGDAPGLVDQNWYQNTFSPVIGKYYKGPVVWDPKMIAAWAEDENMKKIWAIYDSKVYDLTDYFNTLDRTNNNPAYAFLDRSITDLISRQPGKDITNDMKKMFEVMNPDVRRVNENCLNNMFYVGQTDFRTTPRCQVSNYLLIVMSALLMGSMAIKFLAALQFGSKRQPELQDKFVLCQVPCYTEGEDSLRRTIDSLAALNYDDKRKLIFIICDGNIIGSGNDRTTPRIVLDILGVDPKVDPEPLLFKSVGEGSKALNYGKIYSGLYEFEGHVVPYMVVVKVGKPTERSRPGNRGKRDSQILLMQYLNRVHFDSPMNPLELEIYHQMRNVIGIDPAFYEYIFTIDADTTVTPDSLNRLVASSADDSRIIGICGETKLLNEEMSWWTMIQVYEYYISHHLSKAFESLFGSVTCLPGCFSLYRVRTADKGRPIIISNRIIEEYAEPNVDTLHKKNLFSLGEDRFLTTLLMKHFPSFKTKFCPDAIAHTMAPESWKVLFSQRRRWINSTVHNLCELVLLEELFGFCCFSMRIFVFIDLLSTLILPATVVYLVYLIVVVATNQAAFPMIAIVMLALVYGLQAIIFIVKREFMLIGWMVVYIISYPVYSFFLPLYSFWCMDEFSWGNTRVVVGEGKEKKVIIKEDEKFDESMIPLKKFSEYENEAWETGSKHSDGTGYESQARSRSHAHLPPRSRDHSPRGSAYQGSQAGDYYRDTNHTYNNSSNPNLRLPNTHGSQQSGYSQSQYQGAMPMSTFGPPQLPFMPMVGGPGSVAGSDYGHGMGMNMGMMGAGMPMMGYQNTGSVFGMPATMTGGTAPRNTVMSNFGMFGGSAEGGMAGLGGPPPALGGGQQRPMSTFSMATSVNPFAGPSQNPNPTDEELFNALRTYLSTQDLMSVTKKTAREAIMAKFPRADLTTKKDLLNQSIDRILSES
ncbi:chitin synthase [Coprinopsis marcescibilis]|uniref:chitin synthase n=1 Tax=Coprinopsis marcescibilis TaxID=230819 RepID=A0A5C3KVI6_COPMA|nr:chitin synthase [Coprinopsis marcescibilis]